MKTYKIIKTVTAKDISEAIKVEGKIKPLSIQEVNETINDLSPAIGFDLQIDEYEED